MYNIAAQRNVVHAVSSTLCYTAFGRVLCQMRVNINLGILVYLPGGYGFDADWYFS